MRRGWSTIRTADSYDRAVHAIDQVEGVAREDLAWTEAIKDIKVSELVGICIDHD